MKVLLTSGGTKIPIDRVRHIGNMSKGTFPTRIAVEGMCAHKWNLNFIYSEGSKAPHLFEVDVIKQSNPEITQRMFDIASMIFMSNGYLPTTYKDFDTYVSILNFQIENFNPDVVVLAAAVSDYGTTPMNGKIRTTGDMSIQLYPLPKIIGTIKERHPDKKLVGFKLLVDSTDEQLIEAARSSINKNGCDLVVANDLRDIKNNNHRVLLVTKNDVQVFDRNIARVVADRINSL